MKIFIFGAGASQGSQKDLDSPLIDELFDEKYHEIAKEIGLNPEK